MGKNQPEWKGGLMAFNRTFCIIADDKEVARLIAPSDWWKGDSEGLGRIKAGIVVEGGIPDLSNKSTVEALRQIMLERFPNAEVCKTRLFGETLYAVSGLAMTFGVGRSEAAAIAAAMERPLH
jgi:hypothetical protein